MWKGKAGGLLPAGGAGEELTFLFRSEEGERLEGLRDVWEGGEEKVFGRGRLTGPELSAAPST